MFFATGFITRKRLFSRTYAVSWKVPYVAGSRKTAKLPQSVWNFERNEWFSSNRRLSYARRIMGSPGGKHWKSLQRNQYGVELFLRLKPVCLDRECRILPWFYEKWRWLMLVHWNFSDIRWKQVIGSRLKIASSLSGITGHCEYHITINVYLKIWLM